ncbi:MAG: YegS/Rv2252/BmrU family lipid kinase [Sphingomonas sp.]|uniref:diacylglycerol/lipid kinase family protein n=1 Tax=Sphingomonas sp. TaxID=28214 RepID=UPI001AC1FDA3|nr:YegS/Rv2252/BmrU family lipid kinase [Sphingomonas sp.]MBN8807287.1 YegS/Rv2252/BmrU family lipid kinase [Sphingomonas sp.]
MSSFRSAALIVNARSRRGERLFEKARSALAAAPFPVEAFAVEHPSRLEATVRTALDRGHQLIVLGGGDGTISGLVDVMVGTDAVLGVLPLGTANSFARTLGLPLDIAGAVDAIVHGERKRIDLGMIDGDYFANCAAIGLAPQIAQSVPHGLKKWLGRVGYLAWAAWEFLAFRPFTLVVGDGAEAQRLKVVEVRISNGRFHGGTELIDDARLDSGEIVVQAVRGHARRRLLKNWLASIAGHKSRHDDTIDFHARELHIATDPPLPISIDGEVLARTPVVAKAAVGVIEVMVPRGSAPAR